MAKIFASSCIYVAALAWLTSGLASADPILSWRFWTVYQKPIDSGDCVPVSLCSACCQRVWFGNCVEWGQCCNYRTYSFAEWQKDIIRMAFNKVAGIIQDPDVWYYARRDSAGNSISLLYCRVSVDESVNDLRDLMWAPSWPTVNVRPFQDGVVVIAQACAGTVDRVGTTSIWRGTAPRVGTTSISNGEVTIDMNMIHMNARWNSLRSDYTAASVAHIMSDEVAGTIVHEVLHQLGHGHDCTFNGRAVPPYSIQNGMAFFITRVGEGVTAALRANTYVRHLATVPNTTVPPFDFGIDKPLRESISGDIVEVDLAVLGQEDLGKNNMTKWGPNPAAEQEALIKLVAEEESDPDLEDSFNVHLSTNFELIENMTFPEDPYAGNSGNEDGTSGAMAPFGLVLSAVLAAVALFV